VFSNLRSDVARLPEVKARALPIAFFEAALADNGFQAVLLHRFAAWLKRGRIPIAPALVARLNLFLTGVDISTSADIGPGLLIVHGVGIVVGGGACIGRNCRMLQQVTLGSPWQTRRAEMPVVGNDVFLGAGAMLIGAIEVGDGAIVGAMALVVGDVPAGATVKAAPAVVEAGPEGETA